MSDETMMSLRAAKISAIITQISEMYGVSIAEAADLYYKSDIAKLVEDHVADLHCRSDKYIAAEIWNEL